jgi:GTP-binding protein Era
MNEQKQFKAGYVAIIGSPNVGKSTLVNRLVSAKLSIVTPKPQTTRSTIRGILTTAEAQIIFMDTAGIHKPKDMLGEYMVSAAKKTLLDANIICLMVESSLPRPRDLQLIQELQSAGTPVFLLINKVDLVPKESLLPVIEAYCSKMDFKEIIPLSARDGDNVDVLLRKTIDYLPENPPYFPEDITSDQIEREFIAEFIREKIFLNTFEEIPYSTAVVIDDMTEREAGGAYICSTIYVEKDSQKGIIIGKGGQMIKKIGEAARREIEDFMGYQVYLDLHVKVEKSWRKEIKALRRLGYS